MADPIGRALDERQSGGLMRELQPPRAGVDFISNDYLGFAREPFSCSQLSSGAGASRMISGQYDGLTALEQQLSCWYEGEAALFFNSGYEANHGLFSMLGELGYRVMYDANIHASIRMAVRTSRLPAWSFRHNNLDDLERLLVRNDAPAVVVTESLFSMEGDRGSLNGIAQLKQRFGFIFVVDEAHGTGTLGGFTGLTGTLRLLEAVDVRVHTFGKSMGASGACIVASQRWRTALTNLCRPLIYSTSPAPVQVALALHAHERFSVEASGRQAELNAVIACWRVHAEALPAMSAHDGPLQWLPVSEGKSVELARRLAESGMHVAAIRQPTVPKGGERLRISLHSFNREAEVSALFSSLHLLA